MTACFLSYFKFWTDFKSKKREMQLKKGINRLTISTRKGTKRDFIKLKKWTKMAQKQKLRV